ncbi:MAG: hypothetical protein M1820_005134 [Bogoriella megaspora]|nr:MAG: hypothetical protein M1820_005134 [Bogoriella megaspora]
MTTEIQGKCHCGACTFSIPIPTASLPLSAWICSCNTCRKTHGVLGTYHSSIPAPPASAISPLTLYKTSADTFRYFCSTCGCHALEGDPATNDFVIATGCVQQDPGDKTQIFNFRNIFCVDDTRDGGMSDWLPLTRWQGIKSHLPDDWQPVKPSSAAPSKDDKLHASCHCGGVSFDISRPDFEHPAFRKTYPNLHLPGPYEPRQPETSIIANDASKYVAGNCVCQSCRLTNGGDIINWCFVPTSIIILPNGGLLSDQQPENFTFGTLKTYRSSEDVVRSFCGKCGATVFYAVEDRSGWVDVAVGLLDAEEGSRAESWLEWRNGRISNSEDARDVYLMEQLREGLLSWSWGETEE